MKEIWLYKWLEHLHEEISLCNKQHQSGFVENIINIIIAPLAGLFMIIVGLLSSLLLPLFLLKDLYDLYLYINAEKIAKKEAIKKALELKNNIKNWIDTYHTGLDKMSPYMLEKIICEEKPKVEQLPGINAGYQSGILQGMYIANHSPLTRFPSNRYKSNYNKIEKKELLTKEFVNSKHSKFTDFIIEFFKSYNNECNTINKYKKHICDTNRRRSLHDIYLITKYYYPEVTFIDIIKTIISLLKIGVICGSYCSTVNKYVFYTPNVSSHNNFGSTLEFTSELTFNNLKKYIEDEQ